MVGVIACGTSTPGGAADAAAGTDASVSAKEPAEAAADVDAAGSQACTVPQDCIDFPIGPAVSCCISKTCIYGQAAIDALSCTDADVQLILASNYDQSCQSDSDCVGVSEGNFCIPGAGNCPFAAAINKNAQAQYQADIAKTNAAICEALSSCPAGLGPCCRRGLCQMGAACSDSDSGAVREAGADSGDGGPG